MSEVKKDLETIEDEDIISIPLKYSYIKETESKRFLVINDSLLTEMIEETLDRWKSFLDKNKSLYDNVKEIQIDYGKSTDFMKPIVPIELTKKYEICHGYGVNLLLEDFIIGAINYLKLNPIKLSNWDYGFTKRLREKIKFIKQI